MVTEYRIAVEDELKLLHQKAKVHWLQEGDRNSAYFHRVLKTRKNKSRVESICKEDGTKVNGECVADQFLNHFKQFLGEDQIAQSFNQLGDIVQLKLSDDDEEYMVREIADEEIKVAMFDIDSSKAAGPDGFTFCFFEKAWNTIGKGICLIVKEFFSNGKILK